MEWDKERRSWENRATSKEEEFRNLHLEKMQKEASLQAELREKERDLHHVKLALEEISVKLSRKEEENSEMRAVSSQRETQWKTQLHTKEQEIQTLINALEQERNRFMNKLIRKMRGEKKQPILINSINKS